MPAFVSHALLVKVNAYLLSTFIFTTVKHLSVILTYFSIGLFCLFFIDLLELFILRLQTLCHICCRMFSLVCHLSLTLCSFKYFNLYFMVSRIYSMLRKAFPILKLHSYFFCGLFRRINLFALVSLTQLEFIIEFEGRICILLLNAEQTVPNCLLNNLLSISLWESLSHYFLFWLHFIDSSHTFIIPYPL